jgi:intraflagellar transport protein 52
MFSDEWLEKEKNEVIWDVLLHFCLRNETTKKRNIVDASNKSRTMFEHVDCEHKFLDTGNVAPADTSNENDIVPDIKSLSARLRTCLEWEWNYCKFRFVTPQDSDTDKAITFGALMHDSVMTFDRPGILAQIRHTYDELGVPFEPLSLIRPKWESPLPPMRLAVFDPPFRSSIPKISLEKFDLDHDFSHSVEKLNRLTNKYSINLHIHIDATFSQQGAQDSEIILESYIRELGRDVVGLSDDLCSSGAKEILYRVFSKVCQKFFSWQHIWVD